MKINNVDTDLQRYKNAKSNAQGRIFENGIISACNIYIRNNRAKICKIPEPYLVTSKNNRGTFNGKFIANAEPDFGGTLKNGQSIVFEAKYTMTDRIRKSVLTDTQTQSLEEHYSLGAVAGVCVGINDNYFFIPWDIWRDMKKHFKRQYILITDVEKYRIKYDGSVLFLDFVNQ